MNTPETATDLNSAPTLHDSRAHLTQPAQYVSTPFFVASILIADLAATLLIGGVLLAGGGSFEMEFLPMFLLGEASAIYGFVVLLVLCYRMWAALPPAVARMTPGKAVGFMFIPVFNLYWYFEALGGWAQDFDQYANSRRLPVPRVSQALAYALCAILAIGTVVGWIAGFAGAPGLGLVISLPALVLWPLFVWQVCRALNALPRGVIQSPYGERHATGQNETTISDDEDSRLASEWGELDEELSRLEATRGERGETEYENERASLIARSEWIDAQVGKAGCGEPSVGDLEHHRALPWSRVGNHSDCAVRAPVPATPDLPGDRRQGPWYHRHRLVESCTCSAGMRSGDGLMASQQNFDRPGTAAPSGSAQEYWNEHQDPCSPFLAAGPMSGTGLDRLCPLGRTVAVAVPLRRCASLTG